MASGNVTARIRAERWRHARAIFRATAWTRAAEHRLKARQRARRSAMRTAYHRRRRNR